MSRILAALLAATVCAGTAAAQSPPAITAEAPLTLEEALAAARTQSPGIEAAEAGIRATSAARTVAGLRPNPSFEAQTENVAGTGAYRGLSGAETTIGFALPIELGGKRSARVAVAEARSDRAQIQAAIARADLELEVTQAYIEAVAAERRLVVARDQLAIATEGLRLASDRVMVGATSPIDQQRAEVLAINARTAADRAGRSVAVARDNLGRMIGRPVSGTLDLAWFEQTGTYGPTAPAGSQGTLALAAAHAELVTAEAQVRLAQSQRIPDVTLSLGARRLAATNDVAAVFGVSIPIPVFNNGRAAVVQARAERDQAGAQRRMARLDAERAIARAEADVANAAANARAAGGPGLAAAQEAARIARLGYGQGKFGQLELLDAERTLADTRASATDALAAYHDAQARLRRLISLAPADLQIPGDDR